MIRDARNVDIPGIALLLQEAYGRSHYARDGSADIDLGEAKRLLVQCIQRHGGRNGGSTFVRVAEKTGRIEGLIIGTLARVYAIGTKLMASDLWWVASERVDPADPMKLMQGMVEWAWSCPDVIEVKCGTTAIIMSDTKAAGRILERLGLEEYGRIYRMEKPK